VHYFVGLEAEIIVNLLKYGIFSHLPSLCDELYDALGLYAHTRSCAQGAVVDGVELAHDFSLRFL
jgi:hypothetical protein